MHSNVKQQSPTMQNYNYFCINLINRKKDLKCDYKMCHERGIWYSQETNLTEGEGIKPLQGNPYFF